MGSMQIFSTICFSLFLKPFMIILDIFPLEREKVVSAGIPAAHSPDFCFVFIKGLSVYLSFKAHCSFTSALWKIAL